MKKIILTPSLLFVLTIALHSCEKKQSATPTAASNTSVTPPGTKNGSLIVIVNKSCNNTETPINNAEVLIYATSTDLQEEKPLSGGFTGQSTNTITLNNIPARPEAYYLKVTGYSCSGFKTKHYQPRIYKDSVFTIKPVL